MRKIRLKEDIPIMGVGTIPAGEEFMVERFNKRFVYVSVFNGCELRLSRKEVEKVY